MSTMISPTCHHGITGHHGGDVCKNPTKPHRCHPLSTGACQPCLAPQGCTCHRFQIVFEVEVLGMILYEAMKLSHKNYNRIISVQMIQTEYSWIFMMYSNDIINIYIPSLAVFLPFSHLPNKSSDLFSTCQRQRAPRGALLIPIPMAVCRVIPRRGHSPMGFQADDEKTFPMISFIKHRLDSHIRKKRVEHFCWTHFQFQVLWSILKLPKIYELSMTTVGRAFSFGEVSVKNMNEPTGHFPDSRWSHKRCFRNWFPNYHWKLMIWDLKLKTPQIDSPTWCDVDRFTAIVLESPIITAQTLETIQPTKEPTNNHQERI